MFNTETFYTYLIVS
uniref:Uncharacterized protein n=1 Tax=Anguilla anguilla TaxID=7936 RepID=A0A0E9W3P4_ANGAN